MDYSIGINSLRYRERISYGDIFCIICLYFAAYASLSDNLNSIALYIALPLSAGYCFFINNTIRNNKYISILLILYGWLCLCYPLTEYLEPANREIRQVLGCFILSYTIATLSQKRQIIPWLYGVYCLLLICAWKYANENIISDITFGEDRLNDDKLNANHFAYYTFYVTISLYILGEIIKKSLLKKVMRVLFIGSIVLSFYTAIFTASRQILIIQIPLYIILMYVRYAYRKNIGFFSKILFVAVGCTILIITYNKYGERIYEDSLLAQRNESISEDDVRLRIVQEAISLATENPIFGFGPGNARFHISTGHFTHNTYLELLLNTGFVGMLIFVYMICMYIYKQYKRWKNRHNKMYLIFLVFGLFWCIDQIFYVFYSDMWLISFFILVASHSEQYYYNNNTF